MPLLLQWILRFSTKKLHSPNILKQQLSSQRSKRQNQVDKNEFMKSFCAYHLMAIVMNCWKSVSVRTLNVAKEHLKIQCEKLPYSIRA